MMGLDMSPSKFFKLMKDKRKKGIGIALIIFFIAFLLLMLKFGGIK